MVIFIKFNGILNFKIIYFILVVRKSFNWIRNMIEYVCINKIIWFIFVINKFYVLCVYIKK